MSNEYRNKEMQELLNGEIIDSYDRSIKNINMAIYNVQLAIIFALIALLLKVVQVFNLFK